MAEKTGAEPDDHGDPTDTLMYRWECPMCGGSRTGVLSNGDEDWSETHAGNYLRRHITVKHGDHRAMSGITDETLRDHVEIVGVPS